jgi:SAM-dependent methyltransferase
VRAPDAVFADPRLAVLYDFFDDDRRDLDAYDAIVTELGARSVVDVGCGTGSLAVLLASRGIRVIGLDPALASLEVARSKPGAEHVQWLHGDATLLDAHRVDGELAVMTGNVAQVFVDDDEWHPTIDAVRRALRPDGWFVFETRRPEARAWEDWDVPPTTVVLPSGERSTVARTVTSVEMPLVTFESSTIIEGEIVVSRSTLRFRDQDEIAADLARHGFDVQEVREAPDRPGKEMVFIARRLA